MRLIDAEFTKRLAERLIKDEEECYNTSPKSWAEEIENFKCLIDSIPTIEAKPVVHAHWDQIANGFMVCSHCEESVEENRKYSFCPLCGAQMDEFASDNNVGSKTPKGE